MSKLIIRTNDVDAAGFYPDGGTIVEVDLANGIDLVVDTGAGTFDRIFLDQVPASEVATVITGAGNCEVTLASTLTGASAVVDFTGGELGLANKLFVLGLGTATLANAPGSSDMIFVDEVSVTGASNKIASLVVEDESTIGMLEVLSHSTATITADYVTVSTVDLGPPSSPSGRLDLQDNVMIVNYTGSSPIANIQSLITSGYNNTAWTGNGIRSSTAAGTVNDEHKTAVGFAETTDLFTSFPATFEDHSVDSTTVLIKYTWYGDANLSGTVGLPDFNLIAANFGQSPRRWSQGDFNYSTNVNLQDFNLLAGNFGQGGLGPGDAEEGWDMTWEELMDLWEELTG